MTDPRGELPSCTDFSAQGPVPAVSARAFHPLKAGLPCPFYTLSRFVPEWLLPLETTAGSQAVWLCEQ